VRQAFWSALALALLPGAASAQGYRVRLDARTQVAGYRGVVLDSIAVGQVVTGPGGGLLTPDGYAVRCTGANPFCQYFRPGPVRRGGPLSASADLAFWGFGVAGLSVRGLARTSANVGDTGAWPGTEPVELLEGYVEYARGAVTVQGGRAQALSRLGAVGFDGGRLTLRAPVAGLEATAFGGYSLARASALPLTSPALNPLDDYQPRERFLLAGGGVAAASRWGNARAVYQRQVDPATDYFASERAGVDLTLRPPVAGLSLTAGADFDLARMVWGSAEAVLAFAYGPAAVSAGARRYQPHFDLWTIWGAFSPVAYHAVHGAARAVLRTGLEVSGRGEWFAFEPAMAETPLTDVEMEGWRWSAGVRFEPRDDLAFDAGARVEYGPGASSRGFDLAAAYRPSDRLSLSLQGAALERPLEFRYDQSSVWMVGAQVDWRARPDLGVAFGFSRYTETRDRPDAAAFDWNQVRFHARVTWAFGSSADRAPLPPASPGL